MRRIVLGLALLALVSLALTGHAELALTLAPPLLIAALPALGCFPAEALIVARRRLVVPRRRRGRWAAGHAAPSPDRSRARRWVCAGRR